MRVGFRALAAAAALLVSACGGAPVAITHSTVPHLAGGVGAFDVIEIDQKAHRLYAADRSDSGVDVFDTSQSPARFVTTVTTSADPSGLAVAPDRGFVYAGLSDGSVAVIDTMTDALVKEVPTGAKSIDLIEYAAEAHAVFAASGADGTIAKVDAQSLAVAGVFKIGSALEQPRFNPADHLLYVTGSGADALFRLDPNTGRVVDKLPLNGCSPRGLAINPKQDQALIACSSWVLRMDLRNPSDLHAYTQVGGGDVIIYDAAVDRFFVAAPGAQPSEVAVFGGSPIDYVTSVNTGGLGNSAAYDEASHVVFTPDVIPGRAGLDEFKAPAGDLFFSIPTSAVALFGGLIAAALVFLFVIGRLADPIRKPVPAAPPAAPVGATVRPGARKWSRKDLSSG